MFFFRLRLSGFLLSLLRSPTSSFAGERATASGRTQLAHVALVIRGDESSMPLAPINLLPEKVLERMVDAVHAWTPNANRAFDIDSLSINVRREHLCNQDREWSARGSSSPEINRDGEGSSFDQSEHLMDVLHLFGEDSYFTYTLGICFLFYVISVFRRD